MTLDDKGVSRFAVFCEAVAACPEEVSQYVHNMRTIGGLEGDLERLVTATSRAVRDHKTLESAVTYLTDSCPDAARMLRWAIRAQVWNTQHRNHA